MIKKDISFILLFKNTTKVSLDQQFSPGTWDPGALAVFCHSGLKCLLLENFLRNCGHWISEF
jgi:hypothetical protein